MNESWGMEFPETYKGFTIDTFLVDKSVQYKKEFTDGKHVSVLLLKGTDGKYKVTCRKYDKNFRHIGDFKYYSFEIYGSVRVAYEEMFLLMKRISIKLIVDP